MKGGRQIRRTPWQCRCFYLILSSCHFLAAAFARGIFGGPDSCDTTIDFFLSNSVKQRNSSVHILGDFWGKYGFLSGSLCDFLLGIMHLLVYNCFTFSGRNMDSWVARCVTVAQARSHRLLFLVPPFLSFSSCC